MVLRSALFAGVTCVAAVAAVAVLQPAQDDVYRVPVEEARQQLAQTGRPPFVFGSSPPDVDAQAPTPSTVVWVVSQEGAEIMRYVAELSSEGEEATRVSLRLTGVTAGRFGNVEQRLAQNPTIRNLYIVAMREQIASTLERRPYELSRIYPATVAARTANMAQIVQNMERAAEEGQRRDRENIEKAYRDEAAGIRY